MQRSSAAALVLVLALVHGAHAQTSGAQCNSGFDWTFNTRGQSPCTVAAYLDSACQAVPSQAYIEPLNPDSHYTLDKSAANNCFCNTVFYSVISACALCQGEEYVPWPTWNANCSNTSIEQFPNPIPLGTAVPAWAYMPLTLDAWNATKAEAFETPNNTDITASGSASSDSIPPFTSTSPNSVITPTPVTTAGAAANVSPAKQKTDVGAIVGGVVGGVAGLVLAVLALLFWMRHRKAQRRPPSAAFQKAEPLTISPYTPEPVEKEFSPHTLTSPYSVSSLGRLYNADDTSTLPEGYTGHSVYSQSQRGSAIFSAQNGYQPAGIRYMGVPEVY
ncbi:hypothetical protein PsYK624_111490 [Phanerochaete sordida]|uniref:Transmembrane protein n=1 Tax=Phanerochaete sordida TaxID=48140 RepID=A0A9P3GG22_9APHY|nr:hypothetical protein PsYK624_111490 [Phanerochaete sordida]